MEYLRILCVYLHVIHVNVRTLVSDIENGNDLPACIEACSLASFIARLKLCIIFAEFFETDTHTKNHIHLENYGEVRKWCVNYALHV